MAREARGAPGDVAPVAFGMRRPNAMRALLVGVEARLDGFDAPTSAACRANVCAASAGELDDGR
jgi:hypothetical protein